MSPLRWTQVAAVGCLLLACQGRTRPAPADTASAVGDTLDSVGTDAMLLDPYPGEFPPEPDLTAADTLPAPAPERAAGHAIAQADRGRAFGFSQVPSDLWCEGPMSLTIVAGTPKFLAGAIRKAAACGNGFQLSWTTPRRMMTSNGRSIGPFSLAKSKAAIDRIAAVVNPLANQPELLATMFGWSLLDDWLSIRKWGGAIVPLDQIVELVKYADSVVDPRIPLGLRGEPKFLTGADFGTAARRLYTVAQWHERKGPRSLSGAPKERAWLVEQAGRAAVLGIKRQVYSVNIGNIDGGDGEAWATPEQLELYVGIALAFDSDTTPSCGSLSWRYDRIHEQNSYRASIAQLAVGAKGYTRRSCWAGADTVATATSARTR